jgi:histidinol-phosphatase (PHP family)
MIEGYYAIDYQVHSFRSHDGLATIEAQCERAVEIGLDEIGFTEHKDFDPADPVVDHFDYVQYMTEIEQARERFGDRIKIRAGVEIDYQRWFEDEIADYLASHAFDFVMGSVHYVERQMLMTPAYNANRTRHEAYRDYFRAVQDSVESGLFDIVGHLEYANRRGIEAWGAYNAHDYTEELTALFEAMIQREVVLEINTAGLHQVGQTYPSPETVALYAAQGGKLLSIGSDGHHPDKLAHRYTVAAHCAKTNHLNFLTIWQKRERRQVPFRVV